MLGGMTDTSKFCATLQKDLDRVERQGERNTEIQKGQMQGPALGEKQPQASA